MANKNKNGQTPTWLAVLLTLFILAALGSCCQSCDNSDSRSYYGEQRCYYCGKVIANGGRAIHATHEYLNTYSCDYCGHKNVLK